MNPMKLCPFARSIFFTVAVSCLTACGVDGTGTTPPPTQTPDVYAVGFESVGTLFKAVLWKNNEPTVLDSGIYGARAFSVAVANGNVYVAGFEGSATGNNVAVLWTNGTPTLLTTSVGSGIAGAVAVSGTDVYVGGSYFVMDPTTGIFSTTVEYWKNGTPVILNQSTEGGGITAIAVDGSNIYFAGDLDKTMQTSPNNFIEAPVVMYWENGTPTTLTDGLSATETSGIVVQDGHVYVSGAVCSSSTLQCEATYWKDGTAISVAPNVASAASSIAIDGTNTYVSVNVNASSILSQRNLAELSTNGNLVALATDTESAANFVTTYAGDVYVGGADNDTAAYWKNNVLVDLSGVASPSSVYAMTVVPSQ
jgi:hypothetical protein